MAEQILESPIGKTEALKPKFLVPKRRAALPERHEKVSREEEAERALGSSVLAPGACMLLVTLFLLTLAIVPVLQLGTELQTRLTFRGRANHFHLTSVVQQSG